MNRNNDTPQAPTTPAETGSVGARPAPLVAFLVQCKDLAPSDRQALQAILRRLRATP